MAKYRRKHYRDLADIFRGVGAGIECGLPSSQAYGFILQSVTELFAADNPKFDGIKFLEACGLSDDEIVSEWVGG